jgi:hypothetical protein
MVSRTTLRGGKSSLGCLFTLLVFVALAYFGVNVGEVYLRYYRFRDSMAQTARFARQLSDDDIRSRLRLAADTLGLPESAHRVQVRRRDNQVTISTEYYDRVEMPGYVREIHFQPHVESSF